MNAARAGGREQSAGGTTDVACDGQSAAKRAEDGVGDTRGQGPASKRRRHVVLVARRHRAPDHCDTERSTDLEGYGVGR